jgi:uncharacterized protein YceH (UPF0502 family)|tara:strand:+ start:122 stop:412 length:291 start_codon:yes stop_codon:yes gene_type:complete
MSEYRDSSSNNFLSLISGAFIGAAGLAWWLISEADKRKEEKKQKAMMYSSRIQDGSEAIDTNENIKDIEGDKLEQKVEELNSAIADVRRQLEELGQ